uniref:Dimer_Tnp_hAT domain-containing protein n=1 Tax=Strongyloides papillosus TaxID=174720 RepID=A0A0N5C4H6_STREA
MFSNKEFKFFNNSLPSASTVQRYVKDLANEAYAKLQDGLEDYNFVLSFDGYKFQQRKMLSVVIFKSNGFDVEKWETVVFPVSSKFTDIAAAISNEINKVPFLITCDGAASCLKAARILLSKNKVRPLHCSAHAFHLVVTQAIDKSPYQCIKNLFSRARGIAASFRRTENSLKKRLRMPIDVRWNSYLHCFESILENKDEINKYAVENSPKLFLKKSEIAVFEKICEILKIIEVASMSCCNNKCQLYEMTFYIRNALFKLFQLKNNEDEIYKDLIGVTSIEEEDEEDHDDNCGDSSKDEDYQVDEAEYSDSGDSDFENDTDLEIMDLEIDMVENKLDELTDENINNLLNMEVGDSANDKEALLNFIDNLMGNICTRFKSHFNHPFVNLSLFLCPGMVNIEKVIDVKQVEKYIIKNCSKYLSHLNNNNERYDDVPEIFKNFEFIKVSSDDKEEPLLVNQIKIEVKHFKFLSSTSKLKFREFWEKHGNELIHLKQLVVKIFTCQVTSASCERLNSFFKRRLLSRPRLSNNQPRSETLVSRNNL